MTEETLIRENFWLILKIAKKFYGAEKEDLYQAGALGIVKAYQNYKKDGNTKFSTYAYDYIFGEMYQMVFKNQSIKLSKNVLKSYQRIEMARSALAQRDHKIPSNAEVAAFLEMELYEVEQIIFYGSYLMKSMDDKKEEERDYYETIALEESISLDESLALKESISTLKPEEQKIINLRYFKDYTQKETAEKLHMTQVMVSRYENNSLKKMKKFYDMAA